MKSAKKEIRFGPIVITRASKNDLPTDTLTHPLAAPSRPPMKSRLSKSP